MTHQVVSKHLTSHLEDGKLLKSDFVGAGGFLTSLCLQASLRRWDISHVFQWNKSSPLSNPISVL